MTENTLTLTGDVYIAKDRDELLETLSLRFMNAAIKAVSERGAFHVALSGGSSPEPFYTGLVTDPRYRAIPWESTHVWIVDERRVPEDDDRSNYRMISESLLNHTPLRVRNRHPMPVLQDDVAVVYESELRQTIDPDAAVPRLDFVLLGMGDDAHTASLFPGSHALGEWDRLVAINAGPRVTPPDRVTMTYPLLNAARQVAILVTGEKKADMLRTVDHELRMEEADIAYLPIVGIQPREDAVLTWYLDPAAAGTEQ